MIGYFTIKEFIGTEDQAGFQSQVRAVSTMEPGFECFLFLPPYLRAVSCSIAIDSRVFGIVDDTSGLGVALYGVNGADFGYFYDADVQIKKNLSVTGDTAIGGSESIGGDSSVGGSSTVVGNVTAKDCRITLAAMQIPNPSWVDDGHQTDPDAGGHPRYITKAAAVSSLAAHTHTSSAPGTPTSAPIPTPIPST